MDNVVEYRMYDPNSLIGKSLEGLKAWKLFALCSQLKIAIPNVFPLCFVYGGYSKWNLKRYCCTAGSSEFLFIVLTQMEEENIEEAKNGVLLDKSIHIIRGDGMHYIPIGKKHALNKYD